MQHPQTPPRRQGRAERHRVLLAKLCGARRRLADVSANRLPGDPHDAAARVAELETLIQQSPGDSSPAGRVR